MTISLSVILGVGDFCRSIFFCCFSLWGFGPKGTQRDKQGKQKLTAVPPRLLFKTKMERKQCWRCGKYPKDLLLHESEPCQERAPRQLSFAYLMEQEIAISKRMELQRKREFKKLMTMTK